MHAYTRTHGEALTHTDTHTHTRSHAHTHTDTRTRTHTLWPFWFKLPEAPNNFFWLYPVLNVVTSCLLLAFMAPHVTPQELADLRAWAAQGLAPTEIHKRHRKSRRQQRNKLKPLCLTALRKALLGVTHRNIARQMPIKTRRERVYFSLCHLVDTPCRLHRCCRSQKEPQARQTPLPGCLEPHKGVRLLSHSANLFGRSIHTHRFGLAPFYCSNLHCMVVHFCWQACETVETGLKPA